VPAIALRIPQPQIEFGLQKSPVPTLLLEDLERGSFLRSCRNCETVREEQRRQFSSSKPRAQFIGMANGYRSDIDGLRAIAVLLVVGFHTFPLNFPGGFIGVDVFFVISGFLITRLIIEFQATDSFSVLQFYRHRARRILPALCVVIAATLAIGWFVLTLSDYRRLGFHALASCLFFPNLVYWSEAGYFDASADSKPLLHLWSLGVEEQFYLFWPPLLIILKWRKLGPFKVILALSICSLAYSAIATFYEPVAAFYSPLSRLWELGVGGILAIRPPSVRHPNLVSGGGLGLIAGAAFLLSRDSPFPGLLAIIPVLGAALVIAGRSTLLGKPSLVALGLISYPLYLWHWPLLSFARTLGFHTELSKAIIILLSFLLAAATYRFVEYPVRFGSLRASGASLSLAGVAAVLAAAFAVYLSGGVPERFPSQIRTILAIQDYPYHDVARVGRCWLPDDANFASYTPECGHGRIMVWGDSYSGLLATGLPKPYAQFTRSACLPLLTGTDSQCTKGNEATVDALRSLKPERVIIFARWPLHLAEWHNPSTSLDLALEGTLQKVRAQVDDVILLGPAPFWAPDLPEVVADYWMKFGELPDRLKTAVPDDFYRSVDDLMQAAANRQHVRFISLFDALCDPAGCLTHTPESRSDLLAWDYGHLTVEGASYIVQTLNLGRL
jgi:peptidoglycan/LPS O-acetylase OafA/YrhL